MKRLVIIVIALCTLAGAANAQRPRQGAGQGQGMPDPAQMVQMASDMMAKELALDDETTAKFKEVYTAYMTEKMALMREAAQLRRMNAQTDAADGEEMKPRKNVAQNEESAAEQIVKIFERKQKEIEIEQKQLALDIQYCEKFNQVLNPKQILKIYQSQNRFGRGQMGQNHPYGGRPQGRTQGSRSGGQSWPETSDQWME